MEKFRSKFHISFSTKVIVPMVTMMVLLLAVTVWMVNRRLTQQFEADATDNLARAESQFKIFRRSSNRNLVQRFRSLRNEPRYRAVIQSGHLPTFLHYVQDLPDDQGVDIALFTSSRGEVLASAKHDPSISVSDFETASLRAVKRAILGEDTVDTIRVGDHLFDVVSIPVTGSSGTLSGALTFGSEIRSSDVQEFSLRKGGELVLLADDRVIESTIRGIDPKQDFVQLFKECSAARNNSIKRISLAGARYFCSAGAFETLSGDGKVGYLLLSFYEQPLRTLETTKQMLQSVSAFGILLGTAIIWLLVRKVTEPLRVLSATAEAVGKGDFSRRVNVRSRDECGELADAFNQMTENLQRSRHQLENTVETLKTTQA